MSLGLNVNRVIHDNSVTQLDSLVREIGRGVGVISATDDVTYCRIGNGSGTVGGQFRHIFDFVSALLHGMESGRIDYNDRVRDARIETQRNFAIERASELIRQIKQHDPDTSIDPVLVRSEIDDSIWLPSSLGREIEFVLSHTVHHHALIAEKLAGFGFTLDKNFGVAPSTLKYWERSAA